MKIALTKPKTQPVHDWRARDPIGEAAASRIWSRADADQVEILSIEVPSDRATKGVHRGRLHKARAR